MTWEEVIISARTKPEYHEVIRQSYLEDDLVENALRFHASEEFLETVNLIENQGKPSEMKLLDIGCGNGISAISFAREGYNVTALEPDQSLTTGTGAIKKLADHFNLDMEILNGVGELLPVKDQSIDIVYLRQTLHHASDIFSFLKECYRVLKRGGLILTARDHVIFNRKDKEWFLSSHPFHRFYNGENAYTEDEYLKAFSESGFKVINVLRHWDSVINYYPVSKKEFIAYPARVKEDIRQRLIEKLGFPGRLYLVQLAFRYYKGFFPSYYNEKLIPGRLYSFIATKK